MRKAILFAAGLIAFATAASAQSSSRDRDDDDRGGDWREGRSSYRDWDHHRGGSRRDDDEEPGRGARFFLRSGDTQIRVVCDQRESTRACVDAALTMFDRVRSQQGTTGSATPATPGQTAPAPTR
jgi:hypothetical protein